MIGIFDSGFGGLSVFKEIANLMPEYDYIYLGDSARAPYGCRSQEIVYKFTEESVDFLFKNGCELVIIACGTASSEALRKLQQEYLPEKYSDRRILGIIRPLVEEAARASHFGRIGVVGTRSTVESGSFVKELEKQKGQWRLNLQRGGLASINLEIFQKACPLLVPLVEEGWIGKPETKMILKKYLRPLKKERVDTLILGCTHYSLLFSEFRRVMGGGCEVINSGKIVAGSLKNYLERHPEIESKLGKNSKKVFYTTDDVERFVELGGRFFGEKFEASRVEL